VHPNVAENFQIMRGSYWRILFVLTLIGISCSCGTSTQSLGVAQSKKQAPSEKLLDQFWKDFQSALKRKDVSEISRLTRFPLDADLANIEGFEGIGNREGFARHFKTLFPEQAIRTLLNETPKLDADDVESWSICHNELNKVSEMECSIIYCFSRLPNGDIRMTSIHFAG
jgi:hypothetical protein